MGFQTRYDDRIFQSLRYLAGSDQARAEELHRFFEDPDVRAIVSLRGGFGCSRLVPRLNESRLRPHCKLFLGFSDLTTLHLVFRRRFGWVTLHGPMAASATLADIAAGEEAHLYSLLTDPAYLPRLSFPQLKAWAPGVAEGRLIGGCLSIIAASIGTPYEIKTEGKILFLEDFGEPPYRIDRMLTHLRLAAKLDSVAGILLGGFHECLPERGDYTVEEILREQLESLGVPVLANFPAGHGRENWALPLGVRVRLDADARVLESLEPTTA
jgi:muramoyltetrapeptide carboxypeptidase